jgi:hypothetical protein
MPGIGQCTEIFLITCAFLSQLMCFFFKLSDQQVGFASCQCHCHCNNGTTYSEPTKTFLLVYILKCYFIILSFAIFLFRNFRLIIFVEYIYENCLTKPVILYLDNDLLDRDGEVI